LIRGPIDREIINVAKIFVPIAVILHARNIHVLDRVMFARFATPVAHYTRRGSRLRGRVAAISNAIIAGSCALLTIRAFGGIRSNHRRA